MKYSDTLITVPKWISCRTYFFGSDKSRTYISNEKTHTYVLLEGLASDMWKMLADDTDDKVFIKWANDNSVAEQVEGFLKDLAEQRLIIYGNINKSEKTGYGPIVEKDGKQEAKFIEEMQDWLFNNGFMYSIFFELTYRCNLKCVHCYNPKDMPSVELDYELCKKAIDDAYDAGAFKVTFSGGESTLHSRFLELVEYARNKRMSVEIFTNGQRLFDDEKLYKSVLDAYPYRICVSLYSTDKSMHERVTAIKGSFEKTYGLICKLRKENVNVQIKNFLLNFNCMDCIKVKKFAMEVGATSLADISLIPTIEGDKKTIDFALDEESLFKLFTDKESPLYLNEEFKLHDYESIKDSSPCFGGFSGFCISPDGNATICVSLPLSIGNINSESVKEIWQGAVNKNPDSKLYQWQKVTVSDLKECYKEEYCKYCHYCPGMGYLENGYLKKSDVLCNQAKAKMKAYKYLSKNK